MQLQLDTPADAAALAQRLLRPLGRRWRHTQGVAARAGRNAVAVPRADRQLLVIAAWLHDIGYAPPLRDTGFHPLDGAQHLDRCGGAGRLSRLVAHHSGAAFEAAERGLADELAAYPREDGPLLDALIHADMTTSPDGDEMSFDRRVEEILDRYVPESPVHRAIQAAHPYLGSAVDRVEARLRSAADQPM